MPLEVWNRMGKPAKIEALYAQQQQMELMVGNLAKATQQIADVMKVITAPPQVNAQAVPTGESEAKPDAPAEPIGDDPDEQPVPDDPDEQPVPAVEPDPAPEDDIFG